jgi:hypothetical protein
MVRDLREYIQAQLNLHGLGTLVYVKGPYLTTTHFENIGSRDHWEIAIKYRPEGVTNHLDDHRLDVNIGGNNRGGWINQRNIRLAVAAEARLVTEHEFVEVRWKSAQRAITSGSSDGAIEL